MKNKLTVKNITVLKNKITVDYSVTGEWEKYFIKENSYFAEYSIDISSIPKSVAVVPFLANILPVSWIFDAEVIVPVCDKDFFDSIEYFKRGYVEMYPMIEFKGSIAADEIEVNSIEGQNGSVTFFSGGADAFNTLTQHAAESPTLITMWGADIKLSDSYGWEKVYWHLEETARDFHVDFVTIKSSFKIFVNEGELHNYVKAICGDGWWHGFQHGIGIISHAAPVMYVLKKKIVYFASSNTEDQKGTYTCASDPIIDNFVRFCGCNVVHDGYEFTRQMKIQNITQFAKKTGKHISMRVCWESSGGSNCCNCEKCWRTILELYAERVNPCDFGFDLSEKDFENARKSLKYKDFPRFYIECYYKPTQEKMRKTIAEEDLPKKLRWFYRIKIDKLGKMPLWVKILRKGYNMASRIKMKLIH